MFECVGKNRRYGSDVSRAAVNESAIRPRPVSLTRQEVGEEIREAEKPIPVRSWVRFHEASIEVDDAYAVAWTERAVSWSGLFATVPGSAPGSGPVRLPGGSNTSATAAHRSSALLDQGGTTLRREPEGSRAVTPNRCS